MNLKPRKALLISCMAIISGSACAADWNLVWQDEFNDGISSDWVFETGTGSSGWGNNELQYYRSENARTEDGKLVITAAKENYNGSAYTSARMKTQNTQSFTYGRIEARMSLPSGSGLWPAFWMLGSDITSIGWPAAGEIDIMEHVNAEDYVYGTIHWQDAAESYASYSGHTQVDDVTGWHVYAVEWDDQAIRWYVDDVQYHEVSIADAVNGTDEFHRDFFILLNLAVGGNWPGFTVDESKLPAEMYVDYVRVYEGGEGSDFSLTTQAEDFSSMAGVDTEASSDTDGGTDVGWIDSGDWMAYGGVTVPESGTYTVEYRVASPSGGSLSLDLNAGSQVLGQVQVPATGGWQNWTTVSQTVELNAGTYDFGIYAQQGGFNLNWWRLSR